MTRKDVEATYRVVNGIIRSPGKFEGEAVYSPYFWDAFMDGGADEDDGEVITFDITSEDRTEFPELAGYTRVECAENDQGFVICRAL